VVRAQENHRMEAACLEDLGTVEESAAQPPQEMFLET
jgi:hypothetical protein